MKRVLLLVLLSLCLASGPLVAEALLPDNLHASSSKVVTPGINNLAEDQADMLRALGLFAGTGNDDALYRHLTRAEAAALIVRFMGGEQEALTHRYSHPFRDVPGWAQPYVGWLYGKEITYGVSRDRFGSEQPVSYWQFATLLSRISTGADDFVSAGIGRKEEERFIDRHEQDPPGTDFFRADAVSLLTRFLRCGYFRDAAAYKTVVQQLIDGGAFTAEAFVAAGIPVYPIDYRGTDEGGLKAFLGSVPFAQSSLKGLSGNTSYPATGEDYFYAWKNEENMTSLYRMDCLSLEETPVAQWTQTHLLKPWQLAYLGKAAGQDLLGLWGSDSVSLIATDGTKTEVVATGKAFGIDSGPDRKPCVQDGETLVVALDDSLYLFGNQGTIRRRLAAGEAVIGIERGLAILYKEQGGWGIIRGVGLADWQTRDTYRILLAGTDVQPNWLQEGGLPLIRQYTEGREGKGVGIYGEAGLFRVRDERLERVTDRPVLDASGLRIGAGGADVILSHEPGSFYGSSIYQYDGPTLTGREGYIEIERLGNKPPHGIQIDSIWGADSMVFFTSRRGVGMDHYDVFTYYPFYNDEAGRMGIVVQSFEAGRPEISFAEHDAAWYVQEEQERLNALGWGYLCNDNERSKMMGGW